MQKIIDFYKKIDSNKLVPAAMILFWIIYTLFSSNMYVYNSDEVWAYNIASDLNLWEIIKIMHYEGHLFLWYYIIKPFTYIHSTFPCIVKYLNWSFCLASIILIWKKAPFGNIIKIMMLLTSPFLVIYPSIGRCYGLAIFLLLLLTILYKKRLERPVLYAILLFLTANTCVYSAFASFALSLIFGYDLIKSTDGNWKNKKVLIPLAIVLSGFLAIIAQWVPIHIPLYTFYSGKSVWLKYFFIPANAGILYRISVFLVFVPLLQIACYFNFRCIKSKRWLIYAFLTVNALFFLNIFIYSGRNYHYYFLYIYLVMTYWFLMDNSPEFQDDKKAYLSFSVFFIAVSLLFNNRFVPTNFWFFTNSKVIEKSLEKIHISMPKKSTVYVVLESAQNITPYLQDDYNLVTLSGDKIPSYDSYKRIYQEPFKAPADIKLKKGEEAYYLIPNNYIEFYKKYIQFGEIFKECTNIDNAYIICKLPMLKKN